VIQELVTTEYFRGAVYISLVESELIERYTLEGDQNVR
jgi:hypothetical protein